MQVVPGGLAVRPLGCPRQGLAHHRRAVHQPQQPGHTHDRIQCRWVQHRIEPHPGTEGIGLEAGETKCHGSAETVPHADPGHTRRVLGSKCFDDLDAVLGSAIPAQKCATGIAVTMALNIRQNQIEFIDELGQQWPVRQPTKPVAMDEVQHRQTAGLCAPPTQPEPRLNFKRPGRQARIGHGLGHTHHSCAATTGQQKGRILPKSCIAHLFCFSARFPLSCASAQGHRPITAIR